MNLYEIDSAIMSLVDPETGELLDYEAFEQLQLERDKKIEGVALWYKDLMAEAKAQKEEADALLARKKATEAKAERLKGYLDMALCGEKFETPRCVVSFRKTTSVEVEDPDGFIRWAEQNGYEDCIRRKDPEVSKSGVAALIKSGAMVPYARLTTGRSVGVK